MKAFEFHHKVNNIHNAGGGERTMLTTTLPAVHTVGWAYIRIVTRVLGEIDRAGHSVSFPRQSTNRGSTSALSDGPLTFPTRILG